MRFTRIFFWLSLLFLTSCSAIYGNKGVIQNRDTDYLYARSIPPMQVPPGLSSSQIQAHYPVSDRYYPTATCRLDLTPPELYTYQTQPNSGNPRMTCANKIAMQQPVPNFYFDEHTRASETKAGMPIATVLNTIWPFGKKSIAGPSAMPSYTATHAGPPAESETKKVASKTNSGAKADAVQEADASDTTDDSNKTVEQKNKQLYFDRFTRQ